MLAKVAFTLMIDLHSLHSAISGTRLSSDAGRKLIIDDNRGFACNTFGDDTLLLRLTSFRLGKVT